MPYIVLALLLLGGCVPSTTPADVAARHAVNECIVDGYLVGTSAYSQCYSRAMARAHREAH